MKTFYSREEMRKATTLERFTSTVGSRLMGSENSLEAFNALRMSNHYMSLWQINGTPMVVWSINRRAQIQNLMNKMLKDVGERTPSSFKIFI